MADASPYPDHVVRAVPEGQVVYGMQLPIQAQSTLYAAPWEKQSGPTSVHCSPGEPGRRGRSARRGRGLMDRVSPISSQTMFFTIAFDALIAFYVLSRQLRIRPVPRRLSLRLPIVLGIVGLIDLVGYTDNHHTTGGDWAWVLATLVVGALALGAIRAFTVRVWTSNEWVVRQGTWLTMGLWVLSLALHFVSDVGAAHNGAGNFEAASFLLYLAITYGVQNYVVHQRARPLWDALGPPAASGLQINFAPGPGGTGAFFATFRGGPGFGPGGPGFGSGVPGFGPGVPRFGPGGAGSPPSTQWAQENDPTIIDAEVVEDDEGPPARH